MVTLYEVLGLQADASVLDVRSAFRRRALAVHPDKGGTNHAFQLVLHAFETLSDPTRRRRYDRVLLVAAAAAGVRSGGVGSDGRPVAAARGGEGRGGGKRRKEAAVAKAPPRPPAGPAGPSTRPPPPRAREARAPSAGQFGTKRVRREQPLDPAAAPARAAEPAGAPAGIPASASLTPRGAGAEEADRPPTPARPRFAQRPGPWPPHRYIGLLAGAVSGRRGWRRREMRSMAPQGDAEPMGLVYILLRRLLPARRKEVLQRRFTQAQRLALEAWARERGPNQGAAAAQGAAQRLGAKGPLIPALCGACLGKGGSPRREAPASGSARDSGSESCSPAPAAICDLRGDAAAAAAARPVARPAGLVRGISKIIRSYRAVVCIDNFKMTSRRVRDLHVAVDYLVAMTSVKQYAVAAASADFGEKVRGGLTVMWEEHGKTPGDIGMRFSVQLYVKWFMAHHLSTPATPDVELALARWGRLDVFRVHEYRARNLRRQLAQRGCGLSWEEFRARWLDIVGEAGYCRKYHGQRLDAAYEASRTYRELETARAAQRLRQAEAAEAQRRHRRAAAERHRERHQERRQQWALAQEDRRSELWRWFASAEDFHVSCLGALLEKWQRGEDRRMRQQQRSQARDARAAAKRARLHWRQRKLEKLLRWARMNRRDLTMADLLGGGAAARGGAAGAAHCGGGERWTGVP